MEIIVSAMAVLVALSCLVALVYSDWAKKNRERKRD